MNWKDTYQRWESYPHLDGELKTLLEETKNNEQELEDCFYRNMEFGTGGMRGEIGVGPNRMNIYTIRKASEGFAKYIDSLGEEAKKRGVVIAYDCRHKSPEFAMEAAKTLATHGIQTYVFHELRPTPELSFAVRHLNAAGGIVVTASHNPPEYNGYKVYGEDGAQLIPDEADKVIAYVDAIENELTISVEDEGKLKEKGLIKIIGEEIDKVYVEKVKTISLNPQLAEEMNDDLHIVFTPLHGTALKPVQMSAKEWGYKNVTIVEAQSVPDPNFSAVKSANPEENEAFEMAIEEGNKVNADILVATDPDADRLGVATKDENGEYVILTGNQTGALLMHYVLEQKKQKGILPENGLVCKTIVTSEFGRAVGEDFGMQVIDTLTGFKFIGEKIKQYEQTGEYAFQFGYEESYGYLIGDFVRDKDAIQATMLAIEVAAYYKKRGMTLYQGLMELYETYGFYKEVTKSVTLKGKQGAEQIAHILTSFRENTPEEFAGIKVNAVEDYKTSIHTDATTKEESTIHLPKSNVLKYLLEDGSWICLRPSGTEPKIKFYFGVKDETEAKSQAKLETLSEAFMKNVDQLIK